MVQARLTLFELAMNTVEACTPIVSAHLSRISSWCLWQQEVLAVLAEEWRDVLGVVRLADVDWFAWQPFFVEGRSPRAAVARAFERDL